MDQARLKHLFALAGLMLMLSGVPAAANSRDKALHAKTFGIWKVECRRDAMTDRVRCGLGTIQPTGRPGRRGVLGFSVIAWTDARVIIMVGAGGDPLGPTQLRVDRHAAIAVEKCETACFLVDGEGRSLLAQMEDGNELLIRARHLAGDVALPLRGFGAAAKDFRAAKQRLNHAD